MPLMIIEPVVTVVLQASSENITGDVPLWVAGMSIGAVAAPLLVAIKTLYSRTIALSDRAVEALYTEAHALDQLSKAIAEQKTEQAAQRAELIANRGEIIATRSEVSALRQDLAALNARLAT